MTPSSCCESTAGAGTAGGVTPVLLAEPGFILRQVGCLALVSGLGLDMVKGFSTLLGCSRFGGRCLTLPRQPCCQMTALVWRG